MRISGAAKWNPKVYDLGAEIRVTATCPACRGLLTWNVQLPPWTVVAESEPADPNMFETRRAAGKVKHVNVTSTDFRLHCFRCDIAESTTIDGGGL